MSNPPRESQFLIYQAENGAIKIDVRFEDETVWLTQQAKHRNTRPRIHG